MKHTSHSEYFESGDFALAITICVFVTQPILLKKATKQKVIFVFKNSERLQKLVEQYWADNLTVSPHRFFLEQKKLKNRLYSFLES